ncbi:glycosyltransferase family 52 [Sungkyunkwania multivorans]|uniref:Glycosyltransferase family 52 n=1 Tax=Sungkyunkwania multivorans TaxID=1173618 RepID=A0ABW3CU43_9FLAO
MNTPNTFVGSTIYNIYMSIFKIIVQNDYEIDKKQDNLLILVENTPEIEKLIPSLEKSIFFRKVIMMPCRKTQVAHIGKFNYTFRKKQKITEYIEETCPELKEEQAFIEQSDIYFCDTDSSKNYFFLKYPNNRLHMIEDGFKTYQFVPKLSEMIKKKYLTKCLVENGHGDEIIAVHAQNPDQLPSKLKNKAVELNTKKIEKLLSDELKQEIYQLFMYDTGTKDLNGKCSLILTQPLSEDGLVADEQTKIDIYKDIIENISASTKVVIKTHPREITAYQVHFPDAIVLPALFPIEVLSLNEKVHFQDCYTLFSTALENMDNTDKKHYLGNDYIEHLTNEDIKNQVLDFCHERSDRDCVKAS